MSAKGDREMKPLEVALIGCGAIGGAVLDRLRSYPAVRIMGVVARTAGHAASAETLRRLGIDAPVVDSVPALGRRPDLCLECAGHGALTAHVIPSLQQGIPCLVASVGALAVDGAAQALEAAARAGGTRVELIAGAIGAIDALAAAREGGLDEVIYTGTKPAASWRGTPAEKAFDLSKLQEPALIFEGSAREAARLFPRNANVAATVALAGLGLDRTRTRLIADPGGRSNVHHLCAYGAFGEFEFTIRGKPLPGNPKSSALTAWSAVRAVCAQARFIVM